MKVLAYDSNETPSGAEIAEYTGLDDLFRKSDVISLHCPLTPDNKELINASNIEKMKDGVILINNSRGGLVADKDLADALNAGKVYAAGLDVVSLEPIKPDNPLLSAKNCIITPHISWAPRESRSRLMDIAAENLRSFLGGQPKNIVNPAS
jgi:glycerate dehydrogenase